MLQCRFANCVKSVQDALLYYVSDGATEHPGKRCMMMTACVTLSHDH